MESIMEDVLIDGMLLGACDLLVTISDGVRLQR